jgi:hypothetical protein
MNVIVDAMKRADASRALWWFTLLSVIALGLLLRVLTIDRGTPAIGVVVYFGLLTVMMIAIALPTSVIAALAWHYGDDGVRWALVNAIHLRVRTLQRAQWITAVFVGFITFAAMSATGRIPKWHVWMSVVIVNAMIATQLFSAFTRALCIEASKTKSDEHPRYDLRITSFQTKHSSRTSLENFASDDRRARAYWRIRRHEYFNQQLQHKPDLLGR